MFMRRLPLKTLLTNTTNATAALSLKQRPSFRSFFSDQHTVNQLFVQAIRNNDAPSFVKALCERGANANYSERFSGIIGAEHDYGKYHEEWIPVRVYKTTPVLLLAIQQNNIDLVNVLLQHGADPLREGYFSKISKNTHLEEIHSALIIATENRNAKMVELLLTKMPAEKIHQVRIIQALVLAKQYEDKNIYNQLTAHFHDALQKNASLMKAVSEKIENQEFSEQFRSRYGC